MLRHMVSVLSHEMPDGSEQPMGFASRTLTETEKIIFTDGKGGSGMCVWCETLLCIFAGP